MPPERSDRGKGRSPGHPLDPAAIFIVEYSVLRSSHLVGVRPLERTPRTFDGLREHEGGSVDVVPVSKRGRRTKRCPPTRCCRTVEKHAFHAESRPDMCFYDVVDGFRPARTGCLRPSFVTDSDVGNLALSMAMVFADGPDRYRCPPSRPVEPPLTSALTTAGSALNRAFGDISSCRSSRWRARRRLA
jgi:hypothetical protein